MPCECLLDPCSHSCAHTASCRDSVIPVVRFLLRQLQPAWPWPWLWIRPRPVPQGHSARLTATCHHGLHSSPPAGLCRADGSLRGHGPCAGQGGGLGRGRTHLLRGPPGPAAPAGGGPCDAGDAGGHPSHPGSQQCLSLCEWRGLQFLALLGGSSCVVLGPFEQDMPATTRLLQVPQPLLVVLPCGVLCRWALGVGCLISRLLPRQHTAFVSESCGLSRHRCAVHAWCWVALGRMCWGHLSAAGAYSCP